MTSKLMALILVISTAAKADETGVCLLQTAVDGGKNLAWKQIPASATATSAPSFQMRMADFMHLSVTEAANLTEDLRFLWGTAYAVTAILGHSPEEIAQIATNDSAIAALPADKAAIYRWIKSGAPKPATQPDDLNAFAYACLALLPAEQAADLHFTFFSTWGWLHAVEDAFKVHRTDFAKVMLKRENSTAQLQDLQKLIPDQLDAPAALSVLSLLESELSQSVPGVAGPDVLSCLALLPAEEAVKVMAPDPVLSWHFFSWWGLLNAIRTIRAYTPKDVSDAMLVPADKANDLPEDLRKFWAIVQNQSPSAAAYNAVAVTPQQIHDLSLLNETQVLALPEEQLSIYGLLQAVASLYGASVDAVANSDEFVKFWALLTGAQPSL